VLFDTAPTTLEFDESSVDQALAGVQNIAAVFLVWPREGQPYLAKTAVLRRRLDRLLAPRSHSSKMLHLRAIAHKVEYWRYGSRLEANLLQYELARKQFPDSYARMIKLRQASYVKLILSNEYPRTQVTTRLSGGESLHYGPFSTRSAAEAFEGGFLDFFQLRRCQEDLIPSVDHPGCVYGEMNKCLRPCQLVVGPEEYASETSRVTAFLRSDGESLVESIRTARDRLSEELEFEEAARMHKRLERAIAVASARGELATDVQQLCGAAVLPSHEPDAVKLCFLVGGAWRAGVSLSLRVEEGRSVPLDRRIRECVSALPSIRKTGARERQDHLALLASWFFSTWRDGEWVVFQAPDSIPYRKLVNAVHRVAAGGSKAIP
jgi:excinuclease ABC subunit C